MTPFQSRSTRGRILIVEAPSVFREMQSLLLQPTGHDVASCDKPGFLGQFTSQNFDVILLNFDTPGANCTDAVVEVRHMWPESAVIFVAGILTVERTRELAQNGVAVALPRPVDPQVLTERIDAIVSSRQTSSRTN